MTDPLLSLRYPRIFGLYVVYAFLHPLRENGRAQVLWNVIFISASDWVLFCFRPFPLIPLMSSICVFGAWPYLAALSSDKCTIYAL